MYNNEIALSSPYVSLDKIKNHNRLMVNIQNDMILKKHAFTGTLSLFLCYYATCIINCCYILRCTAFSISI